jgi:hypothetical protein
MLNAEALRRIREAERTGEVELDLSGWKKGKEGKTGSLEYTGLETLNRLPPELECLTSLQSLNLSGCYQLNDLSPLASLTSLQSLNLSWRQQLSDLSPLASLTSLQSLNLSYCSGFRRFAPLKSLLPTLKELYLYRCKLDDLSSWGLFRPLIISYVCGKYENVLDKARTYGVPSPQKARRLNLSAHRPRSSFLTPGEISHRMPLKRIVNARRS